MKEIKFRLLRADEIECRPAMVKDGKVTILLYITSRAVVRILNETVGAMNWTMDFKEVNGQVVGRLGIWDEEKEMFIYKEDTGSESNIEAQKGLISDCYKRCLSRWGVDELYTAPRIKVDDDGYGCSGYKVSHIEYNDRREIIRLRIVNRFDKVVFDYVEDGIVMPQNKPVESKKETQGTSVSSNPVLEGLKTFCGGLKATANRDTLKRFYEFWAKKTDTWKGTMDYEKLWNGWLSRERAA